MGSFESKPAESKEDEMKRYKREVDKAVRELDRERRKMESSNEKLVMDIKKEAKADRRDVVKIMAKDYVRVKASITKFYQLRTYLQGVSLKLQTMKSVDAMATAMRSTTKALARVNAQLKIPQLMSVMSKFTEESAKMDEATDMIGEGLDDVFAVDGEEEDEENLVGKVMAELSLEFGSKLAATPSSAPAHAIAASTAKVAVPGTAGGAGAPSAPTGKPPGGGSGGPGDGGSAMGAPSHGAAPPAAGGDGGSDLAARLAALKGGSGAGGGAS